MSTEPEPHAAALERLSALVDGELDGGAVAQACNHWRESLQSRSTWHAYHVIGDVLRSEDLACDPVRDARFLEALRARLATEPVVLAPQPRESSAAADRHDAAPSVVNGMHSRRWAWMAPTVVAAGVAAVAGVLVLTRAPGTLPERQVGTSLAQVAPNGQPSAASAQLAGANALMNSTATEPQTFVANGRLIRDARLDRYLAAHKQFAGSSALGVPSAFLRHATAESADDAADR